MNVVIAFTICIAFVAFGDLLSLKTKVKIPALAGAIIAYLIAIWLGMPKEYPEVSSLAAIGNVAFPIFVASLATSVLPMPIKMTIRLKLRKFLLTPKRIVTEVFWGHRKIPVPGLLHGLRRLQLL